MIDSAPGALPNDLNAALGVKRTMLGILDKRRLLLGGSVVMVMVMVAWTLASASTFPVSKRGTPSERYGEPDLRLSIPYGPRPEQILDLCIPPNTGSRRPGVVFIHGGGWSQGDKKLYTTTCSLVARLGFVGATINYRLADADNPVTRWPAQLVDSQLAVRWLRGHASEFGVDAKHICAWGDSSGAQLAFFLGVQHAIVPSDDGLLIQDQAPDVQCVIALSGPFDLTRVSSGLQKAIAYHLFGGVTIERNIMPYRAASPIFLVNSDTPPTLIIHGRNDRIAPLPQAEALQRTLKHNRVPVDFVVYDGGHVVAGLDEESRRRILRAQLNFLITQRHLWTEVIKR